MFIIDVYFLSESNLFTNIFLSSIRFNIHKSINNGRYRLYFKLKVFCPIIISFNNKSCYLDKIVLNISIIYVILI